MGVFEDTSVRIDGIHRKRYISLGRSGGTDRFRNSRLMGVIYKVFRYDTNTTDYIKVGSDTNWAKNSIHQNANWNFVSPDIWDNPNLSEEENEAQSGGLPIYDDNPQQ